MSGNNHKYLWNEREPVTNDRLGNYDNLPMTNNYLYNMTNLISYTFNSKFKQQLEIIEASYWATNAYLQQTYLKYASHLQTPSEGYEATLPNTIEIRSSLNSTLSLHRKLSSDAILYPDLTNEFLLSIR